MPIAIGGSTFSFMWSHPTLAAMDALNALGMSAFDVIVTPGHLWPSEIDKAGRVELRNTLAARNYGLDSLNPPATDYNLASLTPEVRAFAMAMYGEVIDLAADLGAKGVVVVPGRVSSLLPPPRDQLRRLLEDAIGTLAEHARSRGVVLHVEMHPLTPVPLTSDMLELVRAIASPLVGIAYDVANAEFVGENQADAIAAMGSHLTQIHLSDATRTRWMHGSFGSGTVDLPAVMTALQAANYTGSTILELISHDPLTDFRDSLERINHAG